jgi:ATP/maltotriose-dependent transcriptional regulator MalT
MGGLPHLRSRADLLVAALFRWDDRRMPTQDLIAAGEDALARGDWEAALEIFRAAPPSATAAEGLGWAAWWLHDAELTIRSRETAYARYRTEGDCRGAGRVASWLAADHRECRGDVAVANGWLIRAHRLLDREPECAEHGWLALHEGSAALAAGDADLALEHGRAAADLGRRLEVPDLEAIGLAQEGVALVARGEVAAGMSRLDEGSAIARAENLHVPVSLAWALCYVVSACERVGDFARAVQWCGAMREVAERWHGRQILGICRTSYGCILAAQGDWPSAENELTAAVGDLAASRAGTVGAALARLGELRLRQGRRDEARELFTRAGGLPSALVGLGELALAEGDVDTARDAAERVLRRLPAATVLERLPALELLARADAALGRFDTAAAACAEVRAGAERAGTQYLRGRAHRVAAEVAEATGDGELARREAEDAVDCFIVASAPYDAACARLLLADALAGLGRADRAAAEARTAWDDLTAMGAVSAPSAPAAAAAPRTAGGDLTARELEVIRLVAHGLADADIARRLVVSPHTVHRHVANVRTKLRLPSRAAAVAHASRAGLL